VTYDVGVDDITAFVLAGGRSSRMGSDKALLAAGEITFLERALRITSPVAARTMIVGPKVHYARFGEVLEDIYAGCGPLGGIHAALSATRTELNLVLSVDMPKMTANFLDWMVQQAAAAPELATVPEIDGRPQPLCAVYRRRIGEVAAQLLARGEYKVGRMFSNVPTRMLKEQQIVAAGFSPELFHNVNTPEEYEQCRQA